MTDYTKLMQDFAGACWECPSRDEDTPAAKASRAALQSAIEALIAERDALQAERDTLSVELSFYLYDLETPKEQP